jgi:hypothetical protein
LCGPTWFARADPFEVYSMAVSRLSPFRRHRDTGDIVIGNPLDHLPSSPARPGVVAVLAVLFGSTAFDGYASSPSWRNFADSLSRVAKGVHATVSSSVIRTAGLLVFVAVIAVTFTLAARATGGVSNEERRGLPGQMAHSLIPIVVGYIFASLFVISGRARPADAEGVPAAVERVGQGDEGLYARTQPKTSRRVAV